MATNNLLDIVPTRAMLEKGIKSDDFRATVFQVTSSKISASNQKPNSSVDARLPPKPHHPHHKFSRDGADDDFPPKRAPKGKQKDDTVEFDMKRARHEVIRFGMSGFESQDKKRAQIALAVKLGAKPPKQEYKNYKELLAERKREKEVKESEQRMAQLGKNQVGVASVRCQPKKSLAQKKKRSLGDISQHYGVAKPKLFKSRRKRGN